jgi:hypothetical protein
LLIRPVTVFIIRDARFPKAWNASSLLILLCLFESRQTRIDVLDLNGLGGVIENRLGCPHFHGRRRGWIDQRLQQRGGGRGRSLLEPGHSLPVRPFARIPVSRIELRQFCHFSNMLGATPMDLAASSRLRWVSKATIASSFFRPNLLPWPLI